MRELLKYNNILPMVKRGLFQKTVFRRLIESKLSVSLIAISVAFGSVLPAYSTIDNTVTVTGTAPGGVADAVTDSASESVDVEDADPDIEISKSASITNDVDFDTQGDAGDVVTYTYDVRNTGNTTLTSVSVNDTHDGAGTFSAPTFASWISQNGSPAATVGAASITLLPGASARFTTTYTIDVLDIIANGGGDGDLDNSAVAESIYNDGTTDNDIDSIADTASVVLDTDASVDIGKVAYEGGLPPALGGTGTVAAANRPEGTLITYVYTVENDGSVLLTDLNLSDTHKGVAGALTPVFNSFTTNNGDGSGTLSSNTGNTIDELYPGDVAVYTVTYTITQNDVDTLQ